LILDELDCPLDIQSETGYTPLNVSSSRGDIRTMKLLLDRGAEIESKDKKGRTPLITSFKFGHINAALLLIYRGGNI